MTFLLDHDVPEAIARVAAQAGYTVLRVREVMSPEATDAEVLAIASTRQMVLVTCNRDHFLKLTGAHSHAGVVVLIRRNSRVAECSRFLKLLQTAGDTGLAGNVNFA